MLENIDRLKIVYNNNTELCIRKTVKGQFLTIGLNLVSIVVFIFILRSIDFFGKFQSIIYLFLVVSFLFNAFKPLKSIIIKEQFLFDLKSRTVYKNQRIIATFDNIEFVEIINISDGDGGADSYLLNLRLFDKSSIQIDDSGNVKETRKAAGEIAAFTSKEIRDL